MLAAQRVTLSQMEGLRETVRKAFGRDAVVQNLIWTAGLVAANWIVGQALTWSLGDYVVAGIVSLLVLAAALFAYRNRRPAREGETRTPPSRGQVGPVGHLRLKPLRGNPVVPEESTRAEWDATCEPVSESLGGPFDRGVRLSIENKEGEERDLRCIVTAPDGTRYRSSRRVFLPGPTSGDSFHWPGEFQPKPKVPWATGYYSYAWSGDTGDIVDDRSEILSRRFFYVDEDEIITCDKEVPSSLATPEAAQPRWRATYQLRRDPKHGPGATLRVASTGETFGHFRCRVTNPRGEVAEAAPRTGVLIPVAQTESVVHYPGQFRGALPMMPPGQYIVEWYGLTGIRPDDARVLLARITFDLLKGYSFA